MATSNVEVRVDARQAVQALQGVNQAAGQASTATQQLQGAVAGASTALSRTAPAAQQAAAGMRQLAGAASSAAAATQQAASSTQQSTAATRQAIIAAYQLQQSVNNASAAMARIGRQASTTSSVYASATNVQSVFNAKVANTETAIRAQINALREVQSKVQLNGTIYQRAARQIAEYEERLRSTNSTQNATRAASNGLVSAIGGITAAYAQLRAAQQLVQAGIQREESSRRLTFLARGYGEIALAQQAAARTGRQFGLSITESNQQFAQLYGRLRPLGVSLQDIESAFVGFNTSAKVSGATAAESAGALLQLTQALGSGVLRGQELNSVLEQAPGLVVALTQELNAPISRIRKLAEEGKITSDVVIRALKRAGTEGADELAEAMKGPAQQVKNLQNEFQNLQVEVAQAVLPTVIGVIRQITDALKTAIQYVQDYKEGWDLISTAVANALAPFQGVLNVLGQIDKQLRSISQNPGLAMLGSLAPGGVLAPFINAPARIGAARRQARQGDYVSRFANARDEAFARAQMIGRPSFAAAAIADTGKARGGRKGADKAARDSERAAKAAAEELARVNSVVRERNADIELARIKVNLEDKITAAQAQGDALTERRLQGQQRLVDIQAEYARLLADPQNQNARIQEVLTQQGLQALQAESLRTERDLQLIDQQRIKDGAQLLLGKQQELELLQQTDPLKRDLLQIEQYLNSEEIKKLKLTDEQLGKLREILTVMAQIKNKSDEMKQLYADIGMNIKSGVVDAIQSAVDGTKTLGQVASDVLRSIANKLLDVAINMALFGAMSGTGTGGGLLGGLFKKRAMGGSVTGGQPYLVGERGPELFMPGRSGGIAPAGSFGGGVSVVVNVDASGTSVQGNEPDAAQLGRAVSVAVQAEIIKQQRPGGLLADTRR